MKQSRKLLDWRAKQKRGAIMHPSTFAEIVNEAKRKGYSSERAKEIAGKAYWKTARAKFRKSKHKSGK